MPSNRGLSAHVYKPAGFIPVQTGIPWVSGGKKVLDKHVDLKLPCCALRVRLSGRVTVGTANYASVFPEGLLNLLSGLKVEGTNSRTNGTISLWDTDLASAFVLPHLFGHRAGDFDINNVEVPIPGFPFPTGADSYFPGTVGTFDFRIGVDLPFHPYKSGAGVRPGYALRAEEWTDSVQMTVTFGTQTSLGVLAGTTTCAFSGYGQAAGGGSTPILDVYARPIQMGVLKDTVAPGVIARASRPIASILQSASGNPVVLVQLQKQRTSRIYLKLGTAGANAPAFTTLADNVVTSVGLATGGGTKFIKPVTDIFAYKQNQPVDYEREKIQGYTCLDFLQSGNPDSSLPGNNPAVVGNGSTLDLVGSVAGVGDAYGLVVQEQVIYPHGGTLYAQ